MRAFEVRPLVPIDIEEAVAWYEQARVGLGADFADAAFVAFPVSRVLSRVR